MFIPEAVFELILKVDKTPRQTMLKYIYLSGCAFGDRTPSNCRNLDRHLCYNNSQNCCETCHYMKDPDSWSK